MSRNDDALKVLDGPVAEPEPQPRVKTGFGDTKKIVILVFVALVGVGIAGYQFLGGKSPQAAIADPSVAPAVDGAPALDPTGVESLLKQLEPKPQEAGQDATSVASVEDLVRQFDTYVKDHQVPLAQLSVNPFEVVLPKAAPTPDAPAASLAAAAKDTGTSVAKRRIRDMAGHLTLGSVMLVGDKAVAVINGKLCRPGDRVGELRVETIDRDRVVLTCDGEKTELRLRPKVQTAEGV